MVTKKSLDLARKATYRPEIDGLRALAVILVIINHFNKNLIPSGYLGVDIFFVISGFVITTSLSSRKYKDFGDFISGFYERRIKRIIPALISFVLITSIVICLFNPYPGTSLFTGIYSLFGISNIYLFNISTNYFSESTELNVFTHTWSLGIEEQFYLIFPFIIWFTGFGRTHKNGARNLLYIMIGLSIISILIFLYLYPLNQSAAYFLLPTRLWEMSSGCIISLLIDKNIWIIKSLKKLNSLILISIIILICFLPVQAAIIAKISIVFFTSLLIISLRDKTIGYQILTNSKIIYIGLMSYSLYLWHWGILSISRWTIGVSIFTAPIQIFLIFLFSIISYEFVEKPTRSNKWFLSRTYNIFSGFIILLSSTSVLGLLGSPLKGKLYTGIDAELNTRGRNRERAKTYSKNAEKISYPNYSSSNCHIDDHEYIKFDTVYNNCKINFRGSKTIYFLGNSHTDAYRETHYQIARNKKISIDGTSVSNCSFPPDIRQTGCKNLQQLQRERVINNASSGDLIVIANRYEIYDRNLSKYYPWFDDKETVLNLNTFANQINSKGAKVILFGPTPEFKQSIERCHKQWFRPYTPKSCFIKQNELRETQSKFYKLMQYLDPNIYIYDPQEAICFNDECGMVDPKNKPLYHDYNHLNDYANLKYIYKDFLNFLKKQKLI